MDKYVKCNLIWIQKYITETLKEQHFKKVDIKRIQDKIDDINKADYNAIDETMVRAALMKINKNITKKEENETVKYIVEVIKEYKRQYKGEQYE